MYNKSVEASFLTSKPANATINLLTAGAFSIRFLHFLLAHYILDFKHIKDKK